jgi:hypothetical protein
MSPKHNINRNRGIHHKNERRHAKLRTTQSFAAIWVAARGLLDLDHRDSDSIV